MSKFLRGVVDESKFPKKTPKNTPLTPEEVIKRQAIAFSSLVGKSLLTPEANKNMIRLIQSLISEVSRKSKEVGYDYKNYSDKVSQSDSVIDDTFKTKVLGDPLIKKSYEELISFGKSLGIPNFENIVFETYVKTLVFEMVDPKELSKGVMSGSSYDFDAIDGIDIVKLDDDFLGFSDEEFLLLCDKIKGKKQVHVGVSTIKKFTDEQFKKFFESLRGVRSFSFHDTLRTRSGDFDFSNEKLEIMFSNLNSVIDMDLSRLYFTLKDEQIDIIFKNLTSLRRLNLNYSYFPGIGNIGARLKNLRKLKSLHLAQTDLEPNPSLELSYITKDGLVDLDLSSYYDNYEGSNTNLEQIRSAFSGLKSLKTLSLFGISFHLMSKEKIEAIFSDLDSIETIDLSNTDLHLLSEDVLEIIFRGISKAKNVNLSNCGIGEMSEGQIRVISKYVSNIRNLDLSNNNITSLFNKVGKSNAFFSNLKSIEEMYLDDEWLLLDIGFGKELVDVSLEEVFSNLSNAKKINLNINQPDLTSPSYIINILKKLNSAEEIFISGLDSLMFIYYDDSIYDQDPKYKKIIIKDFISQLSNMPNLKVFNGTALDLFVSQLKELSEVEDKNYYERVDDMFK